MRPSQVIAGSLAFLAPGVGGCDAGNGDSPMTQRATTTPAAAASAAATGSPERGTRSAYTRVTPDALERALLAYRPAPGDVPSRITSARCRRVVRRTETGRRRRNTLDCTLTLEGAVTRWSVQVLRNGCYTATRARKAGQGDASGRLAIFACARELAAR